MNPIRASLAFLLCGLTLFAQQLPPPRLNVFPPRVNVGAIPGTPEEVREWMAARFDHRPTAEILLKSMVAGNNSLRDPAAVSDEIKIRSMRLAEEAAALLKQTKDPTKRFVSGVINYEKAAPSPNQSKEGEARRKLMQAMVILFGREWNQKEEYNSSLIVRPTTTVTDLSQPLAAELAQNRTTAAVADLSKALEAELTQSYPASYKATKGLQLQVSLVEGGIPMRWDEVVSAGRLVKKLGSYDLGTQNLMKAPLKISADLSGVPEGAYLLELHVWDGDLPFPVGYLVMPVYGVRDMESRRTAIEAKLAKIQGHDSTKATIRFPFDLARGLNAGNRDFIRSDFALEVRRSEDLLKALESGKDPLWQAKGNNTRHYNFAEAGEITQYSIYVPTTWSPTKRLPMVVIFHGAGGDEASILRGAVAKMAEKHGYIVVAPLGYRMAGNFYGGYYGIFPGRIGELSEKDVVNVADLVASEYNVDRTRMFLLGNSMGAGGVYHIAAKSPERWAGMAPCASLMGWEYLKAVSYPYERLKGIPLMTLAGEFDVNALPATRETVQVLKQHGLNPTFIEVKGGSHSGSIQESMPELFEFFDKCPPKAGL